MVRLRKEGREKTTVAIRWITKNELRRLAKSPNETDEAIIIRLLKEVVDDGN